MPATPSTALQKFLHVAAFLVGAFLVALTAILKSPDLALPAGAVLLLTKTETLLEVAKGALASFGAVLLGLMFVGLVLMLGVYACTAAQGDVIKGDILNCASSQIGSAVSTIAQVGESAISDGEPAGKVAQTIAVDGSIDAIEIGVCALTKIAEDLGGGKSTSDGAPSSAQVTAILGAYVAAHPALKGKTIDVSHIVLSVAK